MLFYLLDAGAAVLYFTPSGAVGEEGGVGFNIVYHGLFDGVVEFADLARLVIALGGIATAEISDCVRGAAYMLDCNIQVVDDG
jgi:hypothetical protein